MYFQMAAMFDHMTTVFLHKPMVYGVVQQVYGLVVRTGCTCFCSVKYNDSDNQTRIFRAGFLESQFSL